MPKFIRTLPPLPTLAVSEMPALVPASPPPMQPLPRDRDSLVKVEEMARILGVSRRYLHTPMARKAIPVIRLGHRCTRFDVASVLAAVKRFEVEEIKL